MKRKPYLYHKIWNKYHPDDPIIVGDGYCIHHKDGNPENNDINNLCKMLEFNHKSLHNKGENHPSYGKRGESHHFYGKRHTNEAKEKISKANKGRMYGENNYNHKLTQLTINWIRDILNSKEYEKAKVKKLISQKQLAVLFGINQCTISKIKNNKLWIQD